MFSRKCTGDTAKEAFDQAVAASRRDHPQGYSGTIAEKDDFVLIEMPAGADPIEYADHFLVRCDRRLTKWGPAGCVKVKDGEWYFFGWASS